MEGIPRTDAYLGTHALAKRDKYESEKKEEMKQQVNGKTKIAQVRGVLGTALVLAFAFGLVAQAGAQVTPPPTPITITPPVGNEAFLVGHAFGTQGYVCLPDANGQPSWTVNPPRPRPRCLAICSDSRCRSSLTSPASTPIRNPA